MRLLVGQRLYSFQDVHHRYTMIKNKIMLTDSEYPGRAVGPGLSLFEK